jgi:hypothetical protein
MKKTILLSTLLIAFVAFIAKAQITNGGFETWTSTYPDGWVGAKTHTTGLVIHKVTDTDSVHGGVNACGLKNTTVAPNEAHRRFTSVATTITTGTSYILSFWVLGEPTDSMRTSMFTGCILSGSFGYLDYGSYITLSSGWQQITRTLVADTNNTAAEFIIDLGIGTDVVIDDVTVTISGAGISEASQSNLSVYPNPATDMLYINNAVGSTQVEISDILGQTVQQENITNGNSSINVSKLPKGVYFVSLKNEEGIQSTRKIVIE